MSLSPLSRTKSKIMLDKKPPVDSFGLSNEEIQRFQKIFNSLDEDGDGIVTASDLRKAYKSCSFGQSVTIADAALILNEADVDRSGNIDFHEFLAFVSAEVSDEQNEAENRQVFREFDKNGDGRISADDLARAMEHEKHKFSRDEAEAILHDGNPRGYFDLREFVKFLNDPCDTSESEDTSV